MMAIDNQSVSFSLNGKKWARGSQSKLKSRWIFTHTWVLRASKLAAGWVSCGMCTILLDGKHTKSGFSCESKTLQTRKLVTVEGLGKDGKLHPIQQAIGKLVQLQCGYCTQRKSFSAKAS